MGCHAVALPAESGAFCDSSYVDYAARVAAPAPGALPGAAEDEYAACVMRQLQLALSAFPCADRKTFSCEDCAEAYNCLLYTSPSPRDRG